jgi:hypothetical protein
MSTVTNSQSTWQTALSAAGLSLRALARETGISHTYMRAIIAAQKLPSEPVRLRLLARLKNYRAEDLFGPLAPPVQSAPAVLCKRCRGPHTLKSGFFQGIQRYQCRDCGCVFIANQAPLHGRLPVAAAAGVMELFFTGETLDAIRTRLQASQGLQVTVTGLEKMVYRLARKAVKLAGDILPEVQGRWVLDGAQIPGVQPVLIMDVLDSDSGFIIASDVIRQDYKEKDRESVLQKAVHITGLTPETLILGIGLSSQDPDLAASAGLPVIQCNPAQEANLRRYAALLTAKTLLLSRRMSFDSIANQRLLCAAWRVHYNFLSAFKPAFRAPYQSWLDILNAAGDSGNL